MSFFGNLLHRSDSARATAHEPNPYLDQVIATFGCAITDAPRHVEHLVPAVLAAENYFERQIAAIPGPFGVSAQAHATDDFLGAVFPTADEIRIALGRSIEVKEALPKLSRAGHVHVHALLGFRCRSADNGPGRPLVFSDHTLKCLAPEAAEARAAIKAVAFERLLKNFNEHVDRLRHKGRLLAVEWNIANARPAANAAANGGGFVDAAKELTPDNMLRGLCAWLHDPSAHLRVCNGDIKVADRRSQGGEPGVHDLPVLQSSDRRQWIVCLVRFPTHEGVEALMQETRSHRYILI